MKEQIKESSKSLNAWTAFIGLIIAAVFTSQGVEVSIDQEQIADALLSKEGITLVIFFALNLATPIIKTVQRVKEMGFDWKVLVSRNFIAHTISVISVALAISFDEQTVGYITVMLTQAANMIMHYLNIPITKE